MSMPVIVRTNLRAAIRDRLLDGLRSGTLAPGRSLIETALAADLGVSRTPLREALVALAQEGFLRAEPGRGFFVAPLTLAEANELYPLIWTLEGSALRGAAPLPTERLDELTALNRKLEAARERPERALDLDHQWHARLLAGCPNRRLLRMLETLKAQAFRYECAYFRDSGRTVTSVDHHDAIITSLRGGDLDGAARRLEDNWRISLEFLKPWLGAREETS